MRKKYNTPHRSRVVKTRLTEDEYADFTARLAPYGISQSEFLRQAIRRTTIRPVLHVSSVNDELLSAVGKLAAEYGRIGGNLNQIARYLNEYGVPYNTAKSKNDGLSGKNFSGGSVFPDNKAFWKLCFARCLIENGKFPCSHTSTDTFPICQKWAQKKQQIFFGFTASCAAAGRRDIQFLCYRSNRNLNRLSISFVLM